MTRAAELQDLYAFNRWANDEIMAAAARLSEDELKRDLGSSFPTVLGTLAHVAQSDWIWLQRWGGVSPTAPPDWDVSTLPALRTQWASVQDEHAVFVASLDDAELDRPVAYRNLAGVASTNPLWQLLRHVVNHSTYHRGQVTTMLRQLGAATVSTDLVRWYRMQAPA